MFHDLDCDKNSTGNHENRADNNFRNRNPAQPRKFFENNETENSRHKRVRVEKRDELGSIRSLPITERDANRAEREKQCGK